MAHGCFCKIRGPLPGVLITIQALLFRVCVRASDFWKLPHGTLKDMMLKGVVWSVYFTDTM